MRKTTGFLVPAFVCQLTRGTAVAASTLAAVILPTVLLCVQLSRAQDARFKAFQSIVEYIQARHRAPFHRNGALSGIRSTQNQRDNSLQGSSLPVGSAHNVKVNQDRNPWPKAGVASAVDPANGSNYLVMSNDFRENNDHMFFHISKSGGATWTDDSMVGGSDPFIGFAPLMIQTDPGVAFDRAGHSFLSTLSSNQILDVNTFYVNTDTEIEITQGFAHGTYASVLPTAIDDQPCNGIFPTPFCPAVLDKPGITVDNVSGSPALGSIYVYYTLLCNGTGARGHGRCTDGSASLPASSSAILESHSPAAGMPFTPPALVSGSLKNAQFSSMVVDSHGTPHIFFDDFSISSLVRMYESTLTGGNWVVSAKPVATFAFSGLNNTRWSFRDDGAQAPGCAIRADTAYCAFSASKIAGRTGENTPSVYLLVADTDTGISTIQRVNDDAFNGGNHHFFAWATATSDGSVYVGWYDDRHDPFHKKIEYFVGKSTDGGKSFPRQVAVSDAPFDPCIGFPGCIFFGDYTQLVSGPDTVHAAWSDTRNGSMQIFTQGITW